MIRFRIAAEIPEDRRVVLELPPDTPVGKADLTVTVTPCLADGSQTISLRQYFGTVSSGSSQAADNDRIDADLARAYDDSHDEAK